MEFGANDEIRNTRPPSNTAGPLPFRLRVPIYSQLLNCRNPESPGDGHQIRGQHSRSHDPGVPDHPIRGYRHPSLVLGVQRNLPSWGARATRLLASQLRVSQVACISRLSSSGGSLIAHVSRVAGRWNVAKGDVKVPYLPYSQPALSLEPWACQEGSVTPLEQAACKIGRRLMSKSGQTLEALKRESRVFTGVTPEWKQADPTS